MANRKHSKIDGLDPMLKDTVETMLLSGSTYREVVEYLAENDVPISAAAVCRHAQNLNASVKELNIAQENFRKMMEEMEKYPDLDTTEAIIRLTSSNLFQRIANTDETDWERVKLDKVLKESTSLIRAAAYKKQIDIKNQEVLDSAVDEMKSDIFAAMAKENPELYAAVAKYLNQKKQG